MSVTSPQFKLLVLDVDGTMTDGGLYITDAGEVTRRFNVKDGLGIARAVKSKLVIGIISHAKSAGAITKRVEMLGIQKCYVGQQAKLSVLNDWCSEFGLGLEQVAFIGDDLNDMDLISAVGFSACPADAAAMVKQTCDTVLETAGGQGCVREFLDRFWVAP